VKKVVLKRRCPGESLLRGQQCFMLHSGVGSNAIPPSIRLSRTQLGAAFKPTNVFYVEDDQVSFLMSACDQNRFETYGYFSL
jgi:hypothetical protein